MFAFRASHVLKPLIRVFKWTFLASLLALILGFAILSFLTPGLYPQAWKNCNSLLTLAQTDFLSRIGLAGKNLLSVGLRGLGHLQQTGKSLIAIGDLTAGPRLIGMLKNFWACLTVMWGPLSSLVQNTGVLFGMASGQILTLAPNVRMLFIHLPEIGIAAKTWFPVMRAHLERLPANSVGVIKNIPNPFPNIKAMVAPWGGEIKTAVGNTGQMFRNLPLIGQNLAATFPHMGEHFVMAGSHAVTVLRGFADLPKGIPTVLKNVGENLRTVVDNVSAATVRMATPVKRLGASVAETVNSVGDRCKSGITNAYHCLEGVSDLPEVAIATLGNMTDRLREIMDSVHGIRDNASDVPVVVDNAKTVFANAKDHILKLIEKIKQLI